MRAHGTNQKHLLPPFAQLAKNHPSEGVVPLKVVNEDDYNAIRLKSSVSGTAPEVCFYDGGSPTGIVYFWPTASTSVSVTIITPTAKTAATDTTTAFVFPPGYDRYIENALALEMSPDFDVKPSPFLMGAAANAKRLIKRSNARIPQLDICYPNSRGGISIGDFTSGNF